MNIAQGLAHAKKTFGTHEAVVCGNTRYTWNEFEQRTDALARGLASLGIERGDRLAVLMLNCHHYLELYYACARMGAVIVNGWMHTGDLATVDEENYIYIVDRAKDMIISGGENIYSVEVENALYTHPAVLEVAVIGIPHEMWGEAVHAVVVCKPGQSATNEELLAHCRRQIAGYKVPRSIEFMPEALPKSGAGKILKRDLREKYWVGKSRNVN